MSNPNKFQAGEAIIELDEARIDDTLHQHNVNVVLWLRKRDSRITDAVIKRAGERESVKAVGTQRRIELYPRYIKRKQDVYDLVSSFCQELDSILTERERAVARNKASKAASRSSGYHNLAPTARH